MKLYTLFLALTALCRATTLSADTQAPTQEVAAVSEIQWMTDFQAAKAKAKAESKPIFVYFTGSDWCPWCIKMNQQILSTADFQNALSQKVVFVKVDFPRKTQLDKATKEQNDKLSKEFDVHGFPTVILLDSNANRIEKLGFQAGGGAMYAKKVQDILDAYNKKSGS